MFAIPFNFPFRKNDGSVSTIGAEISGGGGGGYVLPPATASTLGGIKVGNNLTIDSAGKLDAPAPTPAYALPTASADTLGGVKIGIGISIDENGAISASGGGGGGSVYTHNIFISMSNDKFCLSLATNSATPLTFDTFKELVNDVVLSGFGKGTSDNYWSIKVTASTDNVTMTKIGGGTNSNTFNPSVHTFVDNVV